MEIIEQEFSKGVRLKISGISRIQDQKQNRNLMVRVSFWLQFQFLQPGSLN